MIDSYGPFSQHVCPRSTLKKLRSLRIEYFDHTSATITESVTKFLATLREMLKKIDLNFKEGSHMSLIFCKADG